MKVSELIEKLKALPGYYVVEIPDGGYMGDVEPVKDLMVDTERLVITLTTY